MKKIIFGILVFAVFIPAAFGQIKAFASFENVKSSASGEHASGYLVKLWKSGNSLVGFIYVQNGLVGDPPVGTIENVKYNAATKKLSFSAKFTAGMFSDKTHDNVPSHDTVKFDGTLTAGKLSGVIKTTNDLCADKCREKTTVSMHKWKDGLASMKNYKSVEDWKLDAKDELDTRGPKW